MSGRIFVKSSYSTHEPISGDCVEASAPEGFRFKGAVQYCGNAACQEVAIPTELTFGKSWYTNTNGACFEVGGFESQIYLRDSKLEIVLLSTLCLIHSVSLLLESFHKKVLCWSRHS